MPTTLSSNLLVVLMSKVYNTHNFDNIVLGHYQLRHANMIIGRIPSGAYSPGRPCVHTKLVMEMLAHIGSQ